MRQTPHSNLIETSFAIPADPDNPEAVEVAWAASDPLAVEYEETRQALKDAPNTLAAARAEDKRRNAADVAAGRPLKNPNQAVEKAERTIAALQARATALLDVLDVGLDEVALAVDETRDDWLRNAEAALDAELEEYREHLRATRASAVRVGEKRGIVRWLRGWKLTRGGDGSIIIYTQEMKYTGPARVAVDTGNLRRYELVRASELLDLLATVEAEEATAAPQLRRHKVAASSR